MNETSVTNPDYIINFYKELYFKELERKDQLTNSTNVQIGITTGLITILFYIITNYKFSETHNVLDTVFIIFSTICIVPTLITIIYLFISYSNLFKGHPSNRFPNISELESFRERILNENVDESVMNIVYKNFLIESYTDVIDSNVKTNDLKIENLSLSKRFSTGIVILIIPLLSIYLINFYTKPEEIKTVKISNIKELKEILKK